MIKLELFSEKILEAFSTPLPPANFEEICVPKTENFPFLLKKKIGARKIKKMWENFQVLEFREFGTAEADY